jgi:hypothetical protein
VSIHQEIVMFNRAFLVVTAINGFILVSLVLSFILERTTDPFMSTIFWFVRYISLFSLITISIYLLTKTRSTHLKTLFIVSNLLIASFSIIVCLHSNQIIFHEDINRFLNLETEFNEIKHALEIVKNNHDRNHNYHGFYPISKSIAQKVGFENVVVYIEDNKLYFYSLTPDLRYLIMYMEDQIKFPDIISIDSSDFSCRLEIVLHWYICNGTAS